MRLPKVDTGHRLGKRLMLGAIRLATRQEPYDVLKMAAYRPEFFGKNFDKMGQATLRGPSPWTVAERELLAAFVSLQNQCPF